VNPADFYNSIEPFIWFGVALVSTVALRQHASPVQRLALAMLLIVFGISDFFETVAWWTPWWLLTWKLVSGAAVLAMVIVIWRRHRGSTMRDGD
jgi:hypothetical protein